MLFQLETWFFCGLRRYVLDYNYHKNYIPERQRLQEDIVEYVLPKKPRTQEHPW